MTNRDYVLSLPDKELAELLINNTQTNIGDYDYDDNPIDWYIDEYITPDNESFQDYEDAVQYTIEWLNKTR